MYAGDFKPGQIGGIQLTQNVLLGVAALFAIPIAMAFLSLTLSNPVARWANIIVAIVLFGFNLIGLPGYPGPYDKFLIIVGLGFNLLTIWYAWQWV